MKKLFNKYFLLTIAIMAVAFYLNKSSLNFFLFQDDFYNFNITRIDNLSGFLNFFAFRSDIIAYRPISLLLYFFTLKSLFGFNALGFRIVSMGIYFGCFLLVFKLITQLSFSRKVGLLTASIWAFSSIHFMSLSQINYNMIGTFFYLLTSLFFLKYLKGKKVFYGLSVISFLFSIGSFEFAVTWPLVIGYYYLVVLKNNVGKSIKVFFPFVAISLIYLVLRSIYVKAPPVIEYQISFNSDSLKALLWYFLWAFNIPEEFKKQVVTNLIIFNKQFFWEYWFLISKVAIGAIFMLLLGVCLPVYYIKKNKLNFNLRLISFTLIWFLVSISPVLLLPNHNFIMYLTLSSIGLYLLIAHLIVSSRKVYLAIPVLIIWVFTSKTTLDFYNINFYTVEAQKVAKNFYQGIKASLPYLPDNSIVYYNLPSKPSRQALMDQEAIRAIYQNSSLSIYYNKEDLKSHIKTTGSKSQVFIYTQQ